MSKRDKYLPEVDSETNGSCRVWNEVGRLTYLEDLKLMERSGCCRVLDEVGVSEKQEAGRLLLKIRVLMRLLPSTRSSNRCEPHYSRML